MNFVIAIALFWVLFMTPSEQLATKIGQVLPDTPAAMAQLPVGDKIVAIDGHDVQTWEGINYRLAGRMGETDNVSITLQSNAQTDRTSQLTTPTEAPPSKSTKKDETKAP